MSVDPSSLIFVVILGIWAYLVQHWVRRREQLATSRSLDRFSEAMRVLERRAPDPDRAARPTTRPYVVAPAAAATAAARGQPPGGRHEQAPTPVPTEPPSDPSSRRRDASAPRPDPPDPGWRRRRMWAAHVFGTLLLWPTLTVTALFVLDLLLVRSARAPSRRAPPAGRLAAPRTGRGGPYPARLPLLGRARAAWAGSSGAARPAVPAATSRSAARDGPVGDAGAARPSVVASKWSRGRGRLCRDARQEAITEVILLEGSWEPVAVPPPTYTMKAKADRPVAAPVGSLPPESDSAPSGSRLQPAIDIDEFDLDSVLDRRRADGE